jgi:ketosteroid isomerase-like protein
MSQENVEKAKQGYENFARGDIPAVLADYSEDVEWHAPAGEYRTGGVHRGHQAIVNEVFMVLAELWEDLRVEPHEFVPSGDRVIVLGTISGRGKATGKSISLPFVHIAEYRNGKLVRFEEFMDTATGNAAVK